MQDTTLARERSLFPANRRHKGQSDLGGSRTHTPRGSRLSTDSGYQLQHEVFKPRLTGDERRVEIKNGLRPFCSTPLTQTNRWPGREPNPHAISAPVSKTGVTTRSTTGPCCAPKGGAESRSLGLEPSSQAYEAQQSTCPPAKKRRVLVTALPRGATVPVADLGVEPSIQAYETQPGAGPSAIPLIQW